ncbi:MAG: class II aldolase/adducin family protein [Deltaproteobacteria bacterium]|nr:class II aldolase/adducin family protein [Deltaproteobacteria bacterium]
MEKEYRDKLADIIKYSVLGYDRFLTIADSGNVSSRHQEGILITASGVSLKEVTKESVLYVGMDGEVLSNPAGLKPSKETQMHLAIYRQRPDVQSVYHVHPAYATIYAIKGKEIPFLTSTAKRKIIATPLVPYAPPGSEELGRYVSDTLSREDRSIHSLLLKDHGIVTFETSLERSFYLAELLEMTAKIAILSKSI